MKKRHPFKVNQTPGATRSLVKDMTAKGLDPRSIAAKLDLSVPGVHYHLRRLRDEQAKDQKAAV